MPSRPFSHVSISSHPMNYFLLLLLIITQTLKRALNILIRRSRCTTSLLTSPHTNRRNSRHEEQDTQPDRKTPDRLHLIARRLGSADPDPVVGDLHVVLDGLDEVGGGARGGELVAVQVGDGHAGLDGDDDEGDHEEGVDACGKEEGELVVEVEDVADDYVEGGDAGLWGFLLVV